MDIRLTLQFAFIRDNTKPVPQRRKMLLGIAEGKVPLASQEDRRLAREAVKAITEPELADPCRAALQTIERLDKAATPPQAPAPRRPTPPAVAAPAQDLAAARLNFLAALAARPVPPAPIPGSLAAPAPVAPPPLPVAAAPAAAKRNIPTLNELKTCDLKTLLQACGIGEVADAPRAPDQWQGREAMKLTALAELASRVTRGDFTWREIEALQTDYMNTIYVRLGAAQALLVDARKKAAPAPDDAQRLARELQIREQVKIIAGLEKSLREAQALASRVPELEAAVRITLRDATEQLARAAAPAAPVQPSQPAVIDIDRETVQARKKIALLEKGIQTARSLLGQIELRLVDVSSYDLDVVSGNLAHCLTRKGQLAMENFVPTLTAAEAEQLQALRPMVASAATSPAVAREAQADIDRIEADGKARTRAAAEAKLDAKIKKYEAVIRAAGDQARIAPLRDEIIRLEAEKAAVAARLEEIRLATGEYAI